MMHWLLSATFLGVALLMYIFIFWLPYRSINLEKCPAACSENSDCWVPGCSKKTECNSGKCRPASGHKLFLSASGMGFLTILGFLWAFIAYIKTKTLLEVDENGFHFTRPLHNVDIPWDNFLGMSFHGVNTRFGKEATVYSITGDTGLFSFLVLGLPENTSTRELELGAIFFLQLTTEQCDELIKLIEDKTGAEPEPEFEW